VRSPWNIATAVVTKRYALGAYHYVATGEGFCENEQCRLADPHRQPGVVQTQLRELEFCPDHAPLYRM
jgi:hypothetical protein